MCGFEPLRRYFLKAANRRRGRTLFRSTLRSAADVHEIVRTSGRLVDRLAARVNAELADAREIILVRVEVADAQAHAADARLDESAREQEFLRSLRAFHRFGHLGQRDARRVAFEHARVFLCEVERVGKFPRGEDAR